jgi:hypothetical protein
LGNLLAIGQAVFDVQPPYKAATVRAIPTKRLSKTLRIGVRLDHDWQGEILHTYDYSSQDGVQKEDFASAGFKLKHL